MVNNETILEFSDQVLTRVEMTESKEAFLASFSEHSFHLLRDELGMCFHKVNQLSYLFLEEGMEITEEEFMYAIPIVAIAQKLGIYPEQNWWDFLFKKTDPLHIYGEFVKGNIRKDFAKIIISNQQTIEMFMSNLYYSWSEVHSLTAIRTRRIA